MDWYQHCGSQCGVSTDEPHHGLVTPLQGSSQGLYMIPRDTCTSMVIAADGGTWKVPRCSSAEEWITDAYTTGPYLIGDKNEIMKFTRK